MRRAAYRTAILAVALGGLASPVAAQAFSSRGFADARLFLYPREAPNDPTHAVAEGLVRYEPSLRPARWFAVAGSFDARLDTHDRVQRRWTIDWQDRTVLRPRLSVRRLSLNLSRGAVNFEVGKQFIRWGRADILNPTDRFAPRDFLNVVDSEFFGVTGVRLQYEAKGNTADLVWVPRFTPSRIPLFDERWTVVPTGGIPLAAEAGGPSALLPFVDGGSRFPGGSQAGIRVARSGPGYEVSASFYNGFNHLPLIEAAVLPAPARISLVRVFPTLRMYGADATIPSRWFTIRGEIGYFTSHTDTADEYGIYVWQIERQARDWLLLGGYAGDFVTRTRTRGTVGPQDLPLSGAGAFGFSAERGLARAFLAHASLTIDVNRSLSLQAAIRQNGRGRWLKAEYTQAYGRHLRATIEGNLISGRDDDFLGEFRRNSNLNVAVRYSF